MMAQLQQQEKQLNALRRQARRQRRADDWAVVRPMLRTSIAVAVLAVLAACAGLFFPTTPKPSDHSVAALAEAFESSLEPGLELSTRGALRRDRDTFFWSLFTDIFGSNPNTPYMWNALPLLGFFLPSPMWSLGSTDAVVLLARRPPSVEYFSFTTFALFMPRRSQPALPFSSLGDSFNSLNLRHTDDGLFAHVVTANARSYALIEDALVRSGLPRDAINLAAVPSDLGLFDDVGYLGVGQLRLGTYFETVLRLFRFANQTEGDAYLQVVMPLCPLTSPLSHRCFHLSFLSSPLFSLIHPLLLIAPLFMSTPMAPQAHHPVLYLKGTHGETAPLPPRGYKERRDPRSVSELSLRAEFDASGRAACARVTKALVGGGSGGDGGDSGGGTDGRDAPVVAAPPEPIPFAPLMIRGLECLRDGTQCLGDCPDAAYFGPHIAEGRDAVELIPLEGDDELHVVSLVDHRALNSSVYGSVAILRPSRRDATHLSKTHMAVRATPIGVTSFEFGAASPEASQQQQWPRRRERRRRERPFVAWAFTRNPAHCVALLADEEQEEEEEGETSPGQQPPPPPPPRARAVDGCTVVLETDLPRATRLAYCERVYLNPATGTGPHWDDLLPAQLFHIRLPPSSAAAKKDIWLPPSSSANQAKEKEQAGGAAATLSEKSREERDMAARFAAANQNRHVAEQREDAARETEERRRAAEVTFARIRLPPPLPVAGPFPDEPLRFLHIIKTGGEAFERHLSTQPSPKLDFAPCRRIVVKSAALTAPQTTAYSDGSSATRRQKVLFETTLVAMALQPHARRPKVPFLPRLTIQVPRRRALLVGRVVRQPGRHGCMPRRGVRRLDGALRPQLRVLRGRPAQGERRRRWQRRGRRRGRRGWWWWWWWWWGSGGFPRHPAALAARARFVALLARPRRAPRDPRPRAVGRAALPRRGRPSHGRNGRLVWPPRAAPQAASEGLRQLYARRRRGPAPPTAAGSDGSSARRRPKFASFAASEHAGALRATEAACGSYSGGASADWRTALAQASLAPALTLAPEPTLAPGYPGP